MSLKYRDEIFEGYTIRKVIDENNVTWYCAKDILEALGYKNLTSVAMMLTPIPKYWTARKTFSTRSSNGVEQNRELLCICREGINLLLEGSYKDKAKEFREWLAGPVLTSIEDTGGYINPDRAEEFTNPDIIRQIIEISNQRTKDLEKTQRDLQLMTQSRDHFKDALDTFGEGFNQHIETRDNAWANACSINAELRSDIDEKDSTIDTLNSRVEYLESKLNENNIVYSNEHPKVEMCRIVKPIDDIDTILSRLIKK